MKLLSKVVLLKDLNKNAELFLKDHYRYPQSRYSIVQSAALGNTFRGFRRKDTYNIYKPSSIFRVWADEYLLHFRKLNKLKNYNEFRQLHKSATRSLKKYWRKNEPNANDLKYYRFAKLVDLLFKSVLNWRNLSNERYGALKSYIHVPLDKYSLQALIQFYNHNELDLPKKPSMNSIKDEQHYFKIQIKIKDLIDPHPAILFDLYAWNYLRQDNQSFTSFKLEKAKKKL